LEHLSTTDSVGAASEEQSDGGLPRRPRQVLVSQDSVDVRRKQLGLGLAWLGTGTGTGSGKKVHSSAGEGEERERSLEEGNSFSSEGGCASGRSHGSHRSHGGAWGGERLPRNVVAVAARDVHVDVDVDAVEAAAGGSEAGRGDEKDALSSITPRGQVAHTAATADAAAAAAAAVDGRSYLHTLPAPHSPRPGPGPAPTPAPGPVPGRPPRDDAGSVVASVTSRSALSSHGGEGLDALSGSGSVSLEGGRWCEEGRQGAADPLAAQLAGSE